MATLEIKFLATTIQMQMHLAVFLPEAESPGGAPLRPGPLKVLWLLHGEGGDRSDWLRLSMVEHHAQEAGIALVMPNVDNSMAMDMAHGGYPYFGYLAHDLPPHVRHLVGSLSAARADNFVAGIGTGGHGAVKWLLRAPQMFSAGACFSGEIDMAAALQAKEAEGGLTDDWAGAFGGSGRLAGSADDVMHLCRELAGAGERVPPIIMAWSEHDESFQRNRRAARELRALGLDVRIREDPERHGWRFWDAQVHDFIRTVVAPPQTAGGRDVAGRI